MSQKIGGGDCVFFSTTGKTAKPAACFARRVKRGWQKYISFRNTVFMI
jgi:hypothetical protein